MPTLVLRTNIDQLTALIVPDLGLLVTAAGGTETFTDPLNIADIRESNSIRSLTSDGAFPGGADPSSNSLILNDGNQDIPPDEVDSFLTPAAGSGSTTTLIRTFTAGVAVRDVVYQKTDGTVDRASASAVTTSATIAGIVEAINVPSAGKCIVRFAGDLSGFVGLTVGSIYILGTSVGSIVEETDTGSGDYPDVTPNSGHVFAEVGHAVSTTTLMVGTIRDFDQI